MGERYAGDCSAYDEYTENHWFDRVEIERLESINAELVKACSELIEWVDDNVWPCPLCGGLTIHDPDCPYIQAVSAIAKAKGE